MSMRYIYQGPPEARVFGALPAGDYAFRIASAEEPYFKNEKWILTLKLIIEPTGYTVYYRPWSGTDRNGEARDGIADLLLAVNRVPARGTEPDWEKLVGARGKCRLKTEIAQQGTLAGKEVNAVHWLHRPHELASGTQLPRVGPKPPEETEPDDLPF